MTERDLLRRYEALRHASSAVLDATADDEAPVSPAHQHKLDILQQALDGHGSPGAATREALDPGRHLLTMRDYQGGVDGGVPFPFAVWARELRTSLDGSPAEEPAGEWPDNWDPTLTELEAMVVATLLQELVARLTATGDPGGVELAAVARELADEVLAPTFVGRQR
jgi:hypothetical protein